MKHATSRLLFSYWDALRQGRAAPERSEIDPGRIRHVLADSFILALEPGGDAVFRLAGTRCSALFGRDLTGTRFADLWGEAPGDEPHRLLALVAGETSGLVYGSVATNADGQRLPLETVLLPLRHHGRMQARVLGALSPSSVPNWLGIVPVTAIETTTLRTIRATADSRDGFGRERGARARHLVVHDGGKTGAVGMPA